MTSGKGAGYSGTPLSRKLGLKSGCLAVAIDAPDHYRELISDAPEDIRWESRVSGGADFIHAFVRTEARLSEVFPRAKRALTTDGMLWISWPKKSSGVVTDLDENVVRGIGLRNGLVDVKVCAVDHVWSGLKFVYRLEDRP